MDINTVVGKLLPSADFNPACFEFTEEEAREKKLWRDERPMPTLSELNEAWKGIELQQALESQNQTCQNLLDKSDKRMVSDWPYPEDKAKNEFFRAELRLCMASEKLVDIPKDPFG